MQLAHTSNMIGPPDRNLYRPTTRVVIHQQLRRGSGYETTILSVYHRMNYEYPQPSTKPCSLASLLSEARSSLVRLTPQQLNEAQRSGDALVLDTRTPTDRALYRCIPGSIHTPRTVLEWRVAMDAPLRLEQITCYDQLLVVVCNEGYSSSLAAATLQRLGFRRATDLIGGVMGWKAAGLPVVDPVNDEVGVQTSCR